ncbi:MAG: glycosyltransferase family 2 protein [Thermodesulfovibrionia bacterium]|nr:glycosyltransferase family 2 protein [Thermodesulfovibrionia bacterium]
MISIVIPTYNASRFIPNLLGSIFKQAVDDMEVIIIDDCSTDNTVELVKQYPVRLIEMERNGGPAKARNKGVRDAKGDIIFFLDSDVVVLDGTVMAVQEYFQKNPSAKCVIGICDTKSLNDGFVPHYMAMFEYIHLIGTKGGEVSVFAPRCGAMKKDFFLEIGGYNESYKGADVEDFELARRVNRTDPIMLNEKMLVRHQFANFKQAMRNYFKRTVMWVHLFFKEKKLDNAGPTAPSNGIAAICAFISFMLLLLMPAAPVLKNAVIFLLIIFFFANLKWWNFMRKEAGLFFAARALCLNYILGIDIMIAAAYGVVSYPFSKKGLAAAK